MIIHPDDVKVAYTRNIRGLSNSFQPNSYAGALQESIGSMSDKCYKNSNKLWL